MIKVFPSILSADFGSLATEAKKWENTGAYGLHIDIMDGHFAPNLTLGPKAVAAIRRSTNLFLDVHLMMYNPFEFIEKFVEAGANSITFHIEATESAEEILTYIRKCNIKAGLSLNPETPFCLAEKYLPLCDLLLLMSVKPGFEGQKFLPKVLQKIEEAKTYIDFQKLKIDIQVDGGIDDKTAKQVIRKGANWLVSGSYLFGFSDISQGVKILQECAK